MLLLGVEEVGSCGGCCEGFEGVYMVPLGTGSQPSSAFEVFAVYWEKTY